MRWILASETSNQPFPDLLTTWVIMNCPNCKRLLYSRLQPKCGFCGVDLPPECRLPDHEIDELKHEMRMIGERRAIAKEKEAKECELEKRRHDA
jgi:hypothetical protein